MEIFLFYILTGLAGGLIGGFLGLGGGIVFVPSLLLIFTSYNIYEGYELQSAIITSLGCVFISSLSAMITHNKNNLILWDAFNKTSLGISVGVLVGIFLLSNSATESLKTVNESYSAISSTAQDLAASSSSVKEAVGLTQEYKENLKNASNSLGAIVDASGQITETAKSMTNAQNDAVRLQKELQDLTENLSKLNKIYVGMYDAMHK